MMQKTLKSIIIDDEESARNVLSKLLARHSPEIAIVDQCKNVLDAVKSIKKHQPDLVFLDIEMPNYAGYELVSFFEEVNFDIIFITAYDNYAVKAFEVSAVDYLLKPIEISRLKAATQKVQTRNELKTSYENYKVLTENLKNDTMSKIVVRESNGQKIIQTKNIIAIEAREAYSYIITTSGNHLMSKNLKHYESILKGNKTFFRAHKSWIINTAHLITFSKSKLELELTANTTAKLSKYKKPDFEELITS